MIECTRVLYTLLCMYVLLNIHDIHMYVHLVYVCGNPCTMVYVVGCVPQHSNLFKDLLENIYMIHTCTSGTNTKIQDGTPSVHSLHTACG